MRPGTRPIIAGVACCVLSLSACGRGSGDVTQVRQESPRPSRPPAVPAEFAAACGKPGAVVDTRRTQAVILHRDCDLTGVVITNAGRGVTVPASGGVANSAGVSVDVAARTKDVTFSAEAAGGG